MRGVLMLQENKSAVTQAVKAVCSKAAVASGLSAEDVHHNIETLINKSLTHTTTKSTKTYLDITAEDMIDLELEKRGFKIYG
jgi:hypothetical protein